MSGKLVLVAGSTRGIGRALGEHFRQKGFTVCFTGRSTETLKEIKAAGGETFAGDLATEAGRSALREFVREKGWSLEGLVLSLGGGKSNARGLEAEMAEWQRLFDLNFFSHARLVEMLSPFVARGGWILSLSSIAGQKNIGAPLPYSTAKAALEHYVACAAPLLAAKGIRFNALSLGNIRFPGGRWEEIEKEDPAKVRKMLAEKVPFGRFGTVEEVCAAVELLASSTFCAGSVLRLDGGQGVSV